MPWAPKYPCPKCRATNCTDPSHRSTWGQTSKRRPEWNADRKRRRRAVDDWLSVNGTWALDDRLVANCPDCGEMTDRFVADHAVPVAYGASESGPLRVHCKKCSDRQGARIGRARQ